MKKMQGFCNKQWLFRLKCLNCKACYKITTFFPVVPSTFIKSSFRLCSTVETPAVESNLNQVTQKPKSKQKHKTSKITRIPKNVNSLVNNIESNNSLRCRKDIIISALHEKEKGVYLMDENVAKDISILLAPELKDGNSSVIEANPGLGFLTDHLLNAGVPYMQLIESNKLFFDYLTKKEFPKHVDIYQNDILKIWKLQFLDKQDDGQRVKNLFSKVSSKDWTDEPAMKIVCAVPDKIFVHNVIENIISNTGFVQFGRPQFFLLIDPLSYYALTTKGYPDYAIYRPNSVLFQVIFDSQILTKVPCTSVLPLIKMNASLKATQQKIMNEDGNFLYVIKLTPHRDLYSNNFDTHLPIFQFFLKQILSSRKNRIIPCIERWSPGYGPLLISKGLHIYTEVGELEPKVLLSIFLDFIAHEETKDDSAFLTSMDSIMLKKELQK